MRDSQVLSCLKNSSQSGDDEHLAEFQCESGDLSAEGRQVVLVDLADLLDEAVFSQAFENTRGLVGGVGGKVSAQIVVAESADVELAAADDAEDVEVVAVEQRYFVTSIPAGALTRDEELALVRMHWAIENGCHWTLDVMLGEDDAHPCQASRASFFPCSM